MMDRCRLIRVSSLPSLLAFAGSSRRDSVNRRLLANAVAIAQQSGALVTHIDLADFPMPLYDGDWEEAHGIPDAAKRLKSLMIAHDGFLIASPEYNGSITPLLKNTIDWCSRAEQDNEPTLQAYDGKIAGLLAASPGALGGLRGLRHAREILGNIGVYVAPAQYALSSAYEAFDDHGALKDSRAAKGVGRVVDQLLRLRVNVPRE